MATAVAEPAGRNKSIHKLLTAGPRVGFTVGRALGGAVVRNRMKRRLREAVRLAEVTQAGAVDVVINPKKSLLAVEFGVVLNEVKRAFVVIEQRVKGGVR